MDVSGWLRGRSASKPQDAAAAVGVLRKRCPPAGSRWRHRKTGVVYAVSTGCVTGATLTPAVLYYPAAAGGLGWVRPLDEFLDGRFERVYCTSEGR